MGYYSNIYIQCTSKALPKLYPVLKKHFPDIPVTQCDTEDLFYFDIFHVKWYTTFENFKEIMSTLSSIPVEQYGYLRLGEETEDIDEQGSIPFLYYTTVHIDTPTAGPLNGEDYIKKHYPELMI
jgi:hypothetical protein